MLLSTERVSAESLPFLGGFFMPPLWGRGTHSSILKGFKFFGSPYPMVGLPWRAFWLFLNFLFLWDYDMPHVLSAFRYQGLCLSQVASDPGCGRLKESTSTFLCCTPVGTSLTTSLSSPNLLSKMSPYMSPCWLQVHSLRGITWHA